MLFALLMLVGCEKVVIPVVRDSRMTASRDMDVQFAMLSRENEDLRAALKEAMKGGYTGAHIIWQSGCAPCDWERDGIKGRASAGWTISDSDATHFKLVRFNPDTPNGVSGTPTTIYYLDGKEIGRIEGFDGTKEALDAILLKHPACKKMKAAALQSQPAYRQPEIVIEPDVIYWGILP